MPAVPAFLRSPSEEVWRERALSEPGRAGCLFCDFAFEGQMRRAIEAGADHRVRVHGIAGQRQVIQTGKRGPKVDMGRAVEARRLYESGMALREVSTALGVTVTTAKNWVILAGGAMRSMTEAQRLRQTKARAA
jgi:hypothetical protein